MDFYLCLVVVVEHKLGDQFEIATQISGKLDEKWRERGLDQRAAEGERRPRPPDTEGA